MKLMDLAVLNMLFSRTRVALVSGALLAAALLGIVVCLLALSPDRIERRTWNKHYTLYIEKSARTGTIVRDIAGQGRFSGLVSRYTTSIRFNTFAGFEQVVIEQLDARMDPLDPRFDPYMRHINRLFDAGGLWEVVYLRSARNVLFDYLYLRSRLRKQAVRWRLLEFDPLDAVFRLLLFIAYCSVAAVLCTDKWIRLALGIAAFPWFVLIALAGLSALLASFLLLPAWIGWFERQQQMRFERSSSWIPDTKLLLSGPAAFLAAAGGLAFVIGRGRPAAGLTLAVASGVPAAALLYCLQIVADGRCIHRTFRALPILRRFRSRNASFRAGGSLYILLALIALCSYPVLRLQAQMRGARVEVIRMRAVPGQGRGLSWPKLSELYEYSGPQGIPDLADYLAHRAYQESLIFARAYSFPRMGERILVSDYRVDAHDHGGWVQQTFRVVKQFKESWLEQTLAAAEPGSVPRLLADQGYSGVVQIAGCADSAARYPLSTILVLVFLMQYLVAKHFNLTASDLYAIRKLNLRRR